MSSSSHKKLRKQLFVDPKVQGALVWRAILYWFTCLIAMVLMVVCWRVLTGPARMFYYHFDDMWFFYGPSLIISLVILPLVLADLIRASNRFAGPMLRLRRSMRDLARGQHVEPIQFRENDFWHDFAEDFNAVVARVQGESTAQGEDTTADSDEEKLLLEAVSIQVGLNETADTPAETTQASLS